MPTAKGVRGKYWLQSNNQANIRTDTTIIQTCVESKVSKETNYFSQERKEVERKGRVKIQQIQ